MVTEIVKDLLSLISRRSIIVMGHPALGGAAFLGEGDHHQGDDGIEGEVGDGHPVLQARPVTHDEDIEILDAATDGDDNPEDEEASKTQYLMIGPMQTSLPSQSSSLTNFEYLTTLAIVTRTVMMSSTRPMM